MGTVKICLDAGHYGKVNRSPVVPAYYESEMTWKLHLLLKAELEKKGFTVTTTRSVQGKDMELTARGRKAAGCDLFLSLHSNAVGTESVDRPVGIYLIPDSSTDADEKSREIAGLLAKTVRKIMGTNQAEEIFCKTGNDRNGDGKRDDYYGVLYGAHSVKVPGVILEHGFHTNKRCAQWLLSEANLSKLAKAEADALAKYYGLSGQGTDKADGNSILYRVQTGAFSSRENAEAQLKKVKAAGFNAFIVKADRLYKLQIGAYSVKKNAEAALEKLKAAGFSGFVTATGGAGTDAEKAEKPAQKSIDEIAREVIRGQWGAGSERKKRLAAAGYDYTAVQQKVNELMK